MKVRSNTQTGEARAAAKASEALPANVTQAIADLRGAKTIEGIGAALKKVAKQLGGTEADPQVTAALKGAMSDRPTGVRALTADLAPDQVKLFLGEATPDGVRKMAQDAGVAIGAKDFKIFSTGDPFTYLGSPPDKEAHKKAAPEDVKNRTVVVVQGDAGYLPKDGQPAYDRPTLLAEALQVAFAARSNGAKKTIVVLPETLNPTTHPADAFVQLAARLVKASGVDEVRYNAALSSPSDGKASGDVRLGLPALGPKTQEVGRALDALRLAPDLDGVQKALTQLDLALTGLKGKYGDAAKELAKQVGEVLTTRVSQLVPAIPAGVAESRGDQVVVFAGHSNPELGAGVAKELGAELAKNQLAFQGASPFTQLGADVKGRPAVVVQTTRQDPYTAPDAQRSTMALLCEALMLCDQAQKAGASDVSLVLPYMPSARSDKQDQKGVGAYAALVARWVDELNLGRVVFVEPHDVHVPVFFRTPVRVISGAEILSAAVIKEIGRDDLVLVRPDEGATKRTKQLAETLELPMVNGQKTRDDNNEKAKLTGLGNKSDVDGKVALVTDDEIATGGTMRQTVASLKENGAKAIHVAVSHANMPLEPEKRHAAMRALRDAGATSLWLLDTQPVGKLPADLAGFVRVVSAAARIAEEAA